MLEINKQIQKALKRWVSNRPCLPIIIPQNDVTRDITFDKIPQHFNQTNSPRGAILAVQIIFWCYHAIRVSQHTHNTSTHSIFLKRISLFFLGKKDLSFVQKNNWILKTSLLFLFVNGRRGLNFKFYATTTYFCKFEIRLDFTWLNYRPWDCIE